MTGGEWVMKTEEVEFLANTIERAIREGFVDLGDRIAQGENPENVVMSLRMIAARLSEISERIDRFK